MYRVSFIIDSEEYTGIFRNMDEVNDFVIENLQSESKIRIVSVEAYSFFDIQNDTDLEHSYRVELLYEMLNPLNPQNIKKVDKMETWLNIYGIEIPN